MDNSIAYDSFTEAWINILGKQFHWGYFKDNADDLGVATTNLTELMADFGQLNKTNKVLDIGCGIGEVSFLLNKKIGCSVDGITNSLVGFSKAKKSLELSNIKNIRFFQEDALSNNFPSDYYDVVWLLEMSHLIENKTKLLEESLRVLKPGGTIILCDLMFKKELSALDIFNYSDVFRRLRLSFGHAIIKSSDYYQKLFSDFNLKDINYNDISNNSEPTLRSWKKNLKLNKSLILNHFTTKEFEDFSLNCDSLQDLFSKNILGYGIIKAIK